MKARLTAYPPDNAAVIRPVPANAQLRIGRVGDCDVVLDHASVSRVHAELRAVDGVCRLVDMGSKNGTYVDGIQIQDAELHEACWLRLGDVYCEFTPLSEAQAAAGEHHDRARWQAVTGHTVRVGQLSQLGDLLDASLRAVMDLSQCERGFVLLEDDGRFRVRASLSLSPEALVARQFSGSVGAVRRALGHGRIVVANDIGQEAWLASRDSVVAAGLSALVCVPLLDDGRVLGAIYADRITRREAITTLDLELLQAFAENASVWIAARRTSEQLDALTNAAEWEQIVAAHSRHWP